LALMEQQPERTSPPTLPPLSEMLPEVAVRLPVISALVVCMPFCALTVPSTVLATMLAAPLVVIEPVWLLPLMLMAPELDSRSPYMVLPLPLIWMLPQVVRTVSGCKLLPSWLLPARVMPALATRTEFSLLGMIVSPVARAMLPLQVWVSPLVDQEPPAHAGKLVPLSS